MGRPREIDGTMEGETGIGIGFAGEFASPKNDAGRDEMRKGGVMVASVRW